MSCAEVAVSGICPATKSRLSPVWIGERHIASTVRAFYKPHKHIWSSSLIWSFLYTDEFLYQFKGFFINDSFMGVSSIREFAAPLMVGVLVGAYSSVCITGALWYVMKKKFAGKGQPAIAAASASAKSSSKPKKARDVSQKDPTQPKKKNRKRVAERLAAEEAAKKQQNDDAE